MSDCTLCPNGEDLPLPDAKVTWLSSYLREVPESLQPLMGSMTCAMMEASLRNFGGDWEHDRHDHCLGSQLKSSVCGCTPDKSVLGMIWAQGVSGTISLVSSALILFDIFRNRNAKKTYYQILIGMCVYDIISSTCYALGPIMSPVTSGLYMARGNDFTCKLQAFGILWGITSFSYNAILSLYFLFTVKYKWSERNFRKVKYWVYIPLNALGLGLALGAIPFYDEGLYNCCIMRPPVIETYLPVFLFNFLPIGIAVLILVISSTMLCLDVYTHESQSNKYSIGNVVSHKRKSRLTRKVFWQSIFYVLSAVVVIPSMVLGMVLSYNTENQKYFYVNAIMAPCQGTFNAIVYFHRRGVFRKWSMVLGMVLSYNPENQKYFYVNAIMSPFQGTFNAIVYFHRRGVFRKWWRIMFPRDGESRTRATSSIRATSSATATVAMSQSLHLANQRRPDHSLPELEVH
eukprot:CAMPEP_0202474590 /NCGR_PEP_ID=MMETSP1360-20130828/92466_1 /ASSEMBLY_ACC=CAM_ASM_000848 /TAXON_ID=515479 /ORGANISM="Licmophora paradoxa, Strain CCMP2313" /LENGTH=458 /DNA_ID=CAMNT_0049101727 /DNA_START=232 /DNA_END=1608 /DNA_ORIENTATION=-